MLHIGVKCIKSKYVLLSRVCFPRIIQQDKCSDQQGLETYWFNPINDWMIFHLISSNAIRWLFTNIKKNYQNKNHNETWRQSLNNKLWRGHSHNSSLRGCFFQQSSGFIRAYYLYFVIHLVGIRMDIWILVTGKISHYQT